MLRIFCCWCLFCSMLAHASDDRFRQQVNELVSLRGQAYQFAIDHQIAEQRQPKLTRAQSNQMRDIALRYIDLRSQLLPYAQAMAPLFQKNIVLKLSDTQPTDAHLFKPTQFEERAVERTLVINPNDAEGARTLLDIQRGLAAALVLMDSYQIAIEPYANNPTLGYLLTYDTQPKTNLRQLANNYHSAEFRNRLARATLFVDQLMAERRADIDNSSALEQEYYTLSQSTVWYVSLHQRSNIDLAEGLRYMMNELSMNEQSLQNTLTYGLSMGFGNMVGLVQTRKGKLSRFNDAQIVQLSQELQPLDILLEKTPFRLSDKMIPGHYGHVAVWLGSEEQLREIGVWDQIAPQYQAKIRQGGRIVEALRPGVTISPLRDFLNIDDLLVLRENGAISQAERQTAVLTALEQVGKEYDFNFDVLTHERIVCSELAYVVFPTLPWPLAQTLGRYTISPDNVAQLAIGDTPLLDPILIYRDGQRVPNQLRETLIQLINPKAAQLAKQ